MTNPDEPGFFQKIMKKVFDDLGARPDKIDFNVLLRKGESLEGVIVVPGSQRSYLSEEQARRELKPRQTLYKVNVYRLE